MSTIKAFRRKMKKNCFFLPKFAFRCLGISANSNESTLYKLYSVVMITAAGLYPWSNLHVLIHNLDDFEVIANAAFNFVGGLSAFLKIVVMLHDRRRLEKIFMEIEKIQDERNTEKWSQKETYNTNRKVVIVGLIYYFALLYFYTGTLAGRIFNHDHNQWKTPISDVSVINITYSPNFEIAWAYQVVAVTIISSAYCVTDFLVAAITVDLTVQFKILRHSVEKTFSRIQCGVSEDDKQVAADDRNWIHLNRAVKHTVLYHLSLIDLANEVEKVCTRLIFLDVTGSVCVICFAVYYASVLPPLDFKAMQSYLEVSLITGSIFFISYCGTELSQASESIATACYQTNFVGTDVRLQKSLMMIVVRSQKPVKLTVGGFVDVSITVFVWILRSTYTYFMVLRKSNESKP